MPRSRKTEGKGLLVDVVSKLTGSRPGEKTMAKLVHDHGSAYITGIQVGRTPVEESTNKLMDLITLGKFGQAKEQYKFDELFHLFMVVKCSDGFTFSLEKIPYIKTGSPKIRPNTDMITLSLNNKKITIKEFIQNGLKLMGSTAFEYTWEKYNCQDFIEQFLKASGLLTNSAKNFIQQNMADTISKEVPSFSKKLSEFVTDLSGIKQKVVNGTGMPRRRSKTSTIPLSHLFSQSGEGLWDFAASLAKQAVKEGTKAAANEGSKALGSHLGKTAGDAAGRRIVNGRGLCGPLATHKDEDYCKPVKITLLMSQEAKLRMADATTPIILQVKPSQKSGKDTIYLTKEDRDRLNKQWEAGKSARVWVLA